MSKLRITNILRRQAYYKPMLRTLKEAGIRDYAIAPPTGRGHPILKFKAAGGEHRIPLPTTPTGGSKAARYIAQEILRRVKGLHK